FFYRYHELYIVQSCLTVVNIGFACTQYLLLCCREILRSCRDFSISGKEADWVKFPKKRSFEDMGQMHHFLDIVLAIELLLSI
ncbi:hypothetical protein ACJX0J_036446, partial [Zea mays]